MEQLYGMAMACSAGARCKYRATLHLGVGPPQTPTWVQISGGFLSFM